LIYGRAEHEKQSSINDLARAEELVRLGESRVAQQQQLIAKLKRRGLSTREAAAALLVLTLSLQEMENHLSILRDLLL
jgi:hypothetical protein